MYAAVFNKTISGNGNNFHYKKGEYANDTVECFLFVISFLIILVSFFNCKFFKIVFYFFMENIFI